MTKKSMPPKFEKAKCYQLADASLSYILALIAPYIISLLIYLVCMMIVQSGVDGNALTSNIAYKIISMLAGPAGFCVVFFAYNNTKNISFLACKPNFKLGLWNTVICIVIPIACVLGLQYFIGGIDQVLAGWGYHLNSITLPLDNALWWIAQLLLVALLPAIFEELVFRGIILNGLRSRFGEVASIFICAALFALMHGSIQQLIYPFILGVVLSWVAIRMNSVFASMLVHFLNNAIVITISYARTAMGLNVAIAYNAWQWVLAVVLIAIPVVVCLLIEYFYFKHKNAEYAPKEEQPVEDDNKKPKKQQTIPFTFWIAIVLGLILFVVGTAIGFMPNNGAL